MARLSPEARRSQLLDVGRTLFADGAYDDVSTDVIREAAGCSIGLVYRHFGSKRGYYHATVASVAEALIEVTEPASNELLPALTGSLDAFLASDAAKYITATELVVDGGLQASCVAPNPTI